MFQACSQVLFVHKHKAVKLNAKIKDSRVSRIQMWREKKTIFLETRYFIYAIFNKKQKTKKTKKKGRGRIVSSVIENLLEMRLNRPK